MHAADSPSSNKRKASPAVSKAKRSRFTARKLTPFCIETATPDDKAVYMSGSPSQAASGDLPCNRPATTMAAGANADKSHAVTAQAKSGVAIATAESEPAGERTQSPAATARTGMAAAAGNIVPPVGANAASPAAAAPAGVVAEPASDSHTHAASATAAEPAGVVTLVKRAELAATEGRASHCAVGASPEAKDNTAAGSPGEASPTPLLPLATSPQPSNTPLACALLPSPSAVGLSGSNLGSQKKNFTQVAVASIADSNLSAFIHALCKADPHWWPGILHPFTTSMAEPAAAGLADPAAALAEPAAAALAEPAAAALAEPAAAALADPAAAALAEAVTALAVTQPLTDAAVANPHVANLAEAPSDAKAPPLPDVSVSKSPGAVAELLGAAAAEPAATVVTAPSAISVAEPAAAGMTAPSAISVAEPAAAVVAAPSAIGVAEPAAAVVTTPSAVSLAEPPDASRAADTLSALVGRPPELVSAANLAEPTAAAVPEPAAAVPVSCVAAGEMPATTLTESPNTAPRGFTTASQPTELPPSEEAATVSPEGTTKQSPPAFSKEATTAAAAAEAINSESAAVCSQQNKKAATEADVAAAAAEATTAPVEAPTKDVRVTEPASSPVSSYITPQQSCGSYHIGTESPGPACVNFNKKATKPGECLIVALRRMPLLSLMIPPACIMFSL